ncbi:MAG: hypothetical protein IPK93_07720 [Solirubrobacterales bacterium]|nr:hypothetical protein [Solirubrobacterales bacterium]
MAKTRKKDILREIRELRHELSGRLDALEEHLGVSSSSRSKPITNSAPAAPSLPVEASTADKFTNAGFQLPTDRDVKVIIRPLHDLSMARIVEQALAETEGVENSNLRELRGDSATIDARVDEGVSLITSLRRKLPVAFDVTDSDKGSFTIALAQPVGQRTDGVAGPDAT